VYRLRVGADWENGIVKTYRTNNAACPNCHKLLDAASGVIGDGPPKPGALSFCAYCGTALVFIAVPGSRSLRLRRMRDSDLADAPLAFRHELARIKRTVLAYKEIHQRRN
jgi:hypothetical protein